MEDEPSRCVVLIRKGMPNIGPNRGGAVAAPIAGDTVLPIQSLIEEGVASASGGVVESLPIQGAVGSIVVVGVIPSATYDLDETPPAS
jgi:hypothetical protein